MIRAIADHDVALSFAGEDRAYVSEVARLLKRLGIRVFYDDFEQVELWGKDLYQHLSDVYQHKADYTVIFASANYAKKRWARHELASAQSRALSESREYILPARFDGTEIPGILPTTAYIDLTKLTPTECVAIIVEKLGRSETIGFDLAIMEQTKRTQSNEEPWRNAHSVTFIVRIGRKVEIEIARSITPEPRDALEIAFMFAHLIPAYGSAERMLLEFVASEHLTWITSTPQTWGTEWTIDGRKLLLFLPRLNFFLG